MLGAPVIRTSPKFMDYSYTCFSTIFNQRIFPLFASIKFKLNKERSSTRELKPSMNPPAPIIRPLSLALFSSRMPENAGFCFFHSALFCTIILRLLKSEH